jgi:hypothetical protein
LSITFNPKNSRVFVAVDQYFPICYNMGIDSKKESEMSTWIKDGKTIVANYLGETVRGTVESSRVKYGGKVEYTVNLEKPLQFPWRNEPSIRVLIDNDKIVEELA